MLRSDFELIYGIKLTMDHRGKMKDMISLSTSCLLNDFYKKRSKIEKSICSKCFAAAMLSNGYIGKALKAKLAKNTEVLTTTDIPLEDIPVLNIAFFRFESFGDLINETQVKNYFKFCVKNPHCNFALWTKNPWIIHNVLQSGIEKPENLNIVVSSYCLNKAMNFKRYEYFIDVIFTVYTADYALENNIVINCGSLKCINCLRCYKKRTGKAVIVNEILKSEAKKYYKKLKNAA